MPTYRTSQTTASPINFLISVLISPLISAQNSIIPQLPKKRSIPFEYAVKSRVQEHAISCLGSTFVKAQPLTMIFFCIFIDTALN